MWISFISHHFRSPQSSVNTKWKYSLKSGDLMTDYRDKTTCCLVWCSFTVSTSVGLDHYRADIGSFPFARMDELYSPKGTSSLSPALIWGDGNCSWRKCPMGGFIVFSATFLSPLFPLWRKQKTHSQHCPVQSLYSICANLSTERLLHFTVDLQNVPILLNTSNK